MSLFQNLNQFAPTPGLGQPSKGVQPATFSARINPSTVATGLQVGTPLKLIAVTGTAEIMTDLAGATDDLFGVIPANTKKNTYGASDVVEVFAEGNTLLLESAAAVNAGQRLTISNTSAVGGGPGVAPNTTPGTKYGGLALTSASGTQQTVLVRIKAGTVPAITAWTAGTTGALVAGTKVVAQTAVTANSVIILTLKTAGGTVGAPYVSAITPGTGFTVTSTSNLDTSNLNYVVIN